LAARCSSSRQSAQTILHNCGIPGRQIAARLGYRNVSSVAAACSPVEAEAQSRRFAKVLTQLSESLSR